jgi:hypothetical protein
MARWRKKPVEIEAVQWLGSPQHALDLVEWIESYGHKARYDEAPGAQTGTLSILTLEGEMVVSPNDYVIKGTRDEFYPRKPDIFKDSYEPLTGTTLEGVGVTSGEYSVVYDTSGHVIKTTGTPPLCYSCGGPFNPRVAVEITHRGYKHETCPDRVLPAGDGSGVFSPVDARVPAPTPQGDV